MQAGRPEKTSKLLSILRCLARLCTQDVQESCSNLAQKMSVSCKVLANLALFLQDLAHVRKVDVNVHFLARILQLAGYVTSYLYFPITDKIQTLAH